MIINIEKKYACNFKQLLIDKDINKIDEISNSIYGQYLNSYKKCDYLKRVEHLIKYFLAIKRSILSVMFYTQVECLISNNMKNIASYSAYYALFHALNTCVMLHPNTTLESAKTLSHTKVIKNSKALYIDVGLIDADVYNLFYKLKMARELYSYKLPLGSTVLSSGYKVKGGSLNLDILIAEVEKYLPKILQLCNLLTHLQYKAWNKALSNAEDLYERHSIKVDEMFFDSISHSCEDVQESVMEDEDYNILGEIIGKWKEPLPMSWVIVDKIFEELGCSWCSSINGDNSYKVDYIEDYLNKYL